MTKPPCPTSKELRAKKTKLGVWVPPVLKDRLDELEQQDGCGTSERLRELAMSAAFPDASGGDQPFLSKSSPPRA